MCADVPLRNYSLTHSISCGRTAIVRRYNTYVCFFHAYLHLGKIWLCPDNVSCWSGAITFLIAGMLQSLNRYNCNYCTYGLTLENQIIARCVSVVRLFMVLVATKL